ncbi:MAG: hypothetical protein ABIP35_00235 [Ginsengibacter sp.]
MQVIHLIDYVLLPFYCVAAFAVVYYFRKKANPDPSSNRIYFISFSLKILGGIASALIFQYYYGTGDSLIYFDEARILHGHILKSPSNIRFLFNDASNLRQLYDPSVNFVIHNFYNSNTVATIRFTTLITFLSANTYITTTILFSLISFTGVWAIYKVFILKYPTQKRLLAWSILYLPSIVFWCSGISKDTICLAAFGWLFFSVYQVFVFRNHQIKYFLLIFVCGIVIWFIKSYIILVILITLGLVGIIYLFFSLKPLKVRVALVSIFIVTLIIILNTENFITHAADNYTAGFIVDKIQEMQHNYENTDSGANFKIGNIDPSLAGLLQEIPTSIGTVLFRPFIWESEKLLTFISGLENFLLLLLTVFVIIKSRIINLLKVLHDDTLILFCLVFALVFASVIGLTTFNFGTIIRYKTIFMPFYISFLILLNHKTNLIRIRKRNLQ